MSLFFAEDEETTRGYQSDSPNIFETPCHTSPVNIKSGGNEEYDFLKNYAENEQNDEDEVESDVYFTESEDEDDFHRFSTENEVKTEI